MDQKSLYPAVSSGGRANLLAEMATEAAPDLTSLNFHELEAELATLASHIYAGTCRWLELVAEVDRRDDWAESGRGSCAEWLAWRCGLAPRAAREHVRVARRLSEVGLIHAAFARGELSYAKVRALTRVATADNEEELLELARALTAAQLERAVRAYRRVTTEEAREQQDDAYLSVLWGDHGSLEIHGRLAPEDGALLLRALDAMRDTLWEQARGSAEPRPTRVVSNAEALVSVADAALAGAGEGRSGGERYQVVIHADAHVLSHDDGEGGCELEEGSALAPETARRLACDASVVSNGRKTRTIPPALRRALRTRDRGCRFPGCENHRFPDAHHVHHWARGGATTLDNLVLLCRRHHRLVHEGGCHVDHRMRFYDLWGRPLPAAPAMPRGHPGDLLERNRDLAIDASTCEPGDPQPCNLGDAVDFLLSDARDDPVAVATSS